jgi:hypothetical protein
MAERKKKRRRVKRQRQQATEGALPESLALSATSPDPDNILYQTDPPYSKPSMYKPKGWTDTVAGYIREAKKLTSCILRNQRLMEQSYQWHVTINFETEQMPEEIRKNWSKVCNRLKKSGIVALWVREISRSNRVHYHLIISSRISKAALEKAIEEAMPPREIIGWHKRLQRIEEGETWQLAHYITKAQIAGYVNGRPVDDYYASKRLLFRPKLGLLKTRHIGKFWVKPKGAIWTDIRENEERIAEGLEQPGVRMLVDHVYNLLDRTVPLRRIERAFGYHANSEPVKRWIEQLIAEDNESY